MILSAIVGACFFAGVVAVIAIPWIVWASERQH